MRTYWLALADYSLLLTLTLVNSIKVIVPCSTFFGSTPGSIWLLRICSLRRRLLSRMALIEYCIPFGKQPLRHLVLRFQTSTWRQLSVWFLGLWTFYWLSPFLLPYGRRYPDRSCILSFSQSLCCPERLVHLIATQPPVVLSCYWTTPTA